MQYITTKNLFRIRILLLAGTILIVAIVFIDAFTSNSLQIRSMGRKGPKNLKAQHEELKRADELLHAGLWQLQDMDQRFASQLVMQNNDQTELVKTNGSIQDAEKAFQKSMDSIAGIGAGYDEESGTNDFQIMITFFKKILENRRFIAFTRTGVISGTPGNEKEIILKLQNELYEKEKMIESSDNNKSLITLQNQLGEKDQRIFALETEIQKDEAEKKQYTEHRQKLEGELAEKDKIIASSGGTKSAPDQKTILNLQTDLTAKNKQITDLQTLANSEKQNYTQSIQKLQSQLGEKDKIIASATSKKLPADQKIIVNLQNEISAKNNQINDLQAQVQKESSEKKSYSQSLQKFRSDLVEKDKMIDALSNIKIPTDQKALASLQTEIGAKNKQISQLQSELTEKNKTSASVSNNNLPADQKAMSSLQAELSAKNKQISMLQTEIRKELGEKQSYTQTIHNLQVDLIEKNKIIASSANKNATTDQKALAALQNEIAEKDKRLKKLEDQLSKSSANTPAEGESVKDLQQRNNNLRLAYNNTMTQLGTLQKKYNLLKAEMDQFKAQR